MVCLRLKTKKQRNSTSSSAESRVKICLMSSNRCQTITRVSHEKALIVRMCLVKLSKEGMLEFPTEKRWLTGDEYAFLLRHYKAYSEVFSEEIVTGFHKHPDQVYTMPRNGQIYFIKGWHLREFGFPRKEELRKKFKWKKMNFTTDLPKNDPLCSYLVATGRVGRECYRMHVVVNSQGKKSTEDLQN